MKEIREREGKKWREERVKGGGGRVKERLEKGSVKERGGDGVRWVDRESEMDRARVGGKGEMRKRRGADEKAREKWGEGEGEMRWGHGEGKRR